MRDEPLKYKEEFDLAWSAVINKLTLEFSNEFCLPDGRIDWVKFVKLVSEAPKPKTPKPSKPKK